MIRVQASDGHRDTGRSVEARTRPKPEYSVVVPITSRRKDRRGEPLASALGDDGLRRGDGGRSAGREGFEEFIVVGREVRPVFHAVDRDKHAESRAAEGEREHSS